ncbi:hypothetical protein WUBG_15842 [Wuchereria bancrofti]|uniref:Uncharacterized protein n=1 Tax=Wuchereria bancrofti TaxID=6293 RepID=J9E8E2_WUCBA|nr:hypothetical protein WUBG_15842 [Wuchereria bancrofti]
MKLYKDSNSLRNCAVIRLEEYCSQRTADLDLSALITRPLLATGGSMLGSVAVGTRTNVGIVPRPAIHANPAAISVEPVEIVQDRIQESLESIPLQSPSESKSFL